MAGISLLKAEFEPDDYDWIHTVRFQIAVPRIIRLLAYDKLPRQDVKFNRRNIYARDSNRCQYCGKAHADHRAVAGSRRAQEPGWPQHLGKYCLLLRACNVKKGGRTPDQAHMHLITKPVKPKRSPVINIRLADARYSSWKQFLDTAYWTVELK